MTKRTGMRSMMLAVGLVLAGIGAASAQAPTTAAPSATAGRQAAAAPAGAASVAPTTAAAAPTAQPDSPLLAMDGAPAMSPVAHVGQPTDGVTYLQPQVTKNGRFAHWFHDVILFPVTVAVSLLVLALLVWVVIRYRQAANPVPSRTSHNTVIEVIWTLAPVAALVAIAVPSIGLLQAQFKPAPAGAVTLKAIGNQWYWSYQYPDNGGFEITANMLKEKGQAQAGERTRTDADGPKLLATDNRIVLPVGVPIRLITTSNDVIHSWAMPAFWIKLDAVPGRLNETSFTIEKPGVYFGQCSELCGARHGFMPIAVEAVAPAQFAAWVKAKGGTMPKGSIGGPAGTAAPSDKVIPQPGADLNPMSNASVPAATENGAMESAQPVNQRATGNPAGAGNAGL